MEGSVKRFVLVVGLISVAALTSYVQIIFLSISLLTFSCVVAGFLVFWQLEVEVPLGFDPFCPWPDAEPGATGAKGVPLWVHDVEPPVLDPPRQVILAIQLRNQVILFGTGGMAALASAWFLSSGRGVMRQMEVPLVPITRDTFVVEFLSIASAFFFSLAYTWFGERRILRHARIAVGTVLDATSLNSRPRMVQYTFRDEAGGYRGGYGNDFRPKPQPSSVLVVYDATNPGRSRPNCSFMFHRFVLRTRPAENTT